MAQSEAEVRSWPRSVLRAMSLDHAVPPGEAADEREARLRRQVEAADRLAEACMTVNGDDDPPRRFLCHMCDQHNTHAPTCRLAAYFAEREGANG